MIETHGLTKVYKNGFKAVDGLDLKIGQGDIFGFLGPNGAGKTTTIRTLDGLLQPTSGTAFIDGMDITRQPVDIRRIIGVVPESHGYYYSMTAKEYLEYFSAFFNLTHDDTAYVEYLLRRVGLFEKKNVAIGQFSRGMKQRLGVAKALINRPKIIFLDEPTLGLDPRGQHEIQQLLLEINKTDGVTIFITSHLLKDIEVLGSKVCIVKSGRPVEKGSINELRKKLMPSYTLLMSTSDNLRAIAELMTVPNVLCVSMTEDEKLSIKLRPECSENTLLALSKQCVFYGLFGFIVSDTKAGFIAFLNILKAVLCAGCVAGDNDFIGCSLKHSRNAAVGLYAGCIHDGIYAVYAHTYSVLFIRYGSGLDTCHASACYDFYAILLEAVKHDLIGYRFAVEHDIRLHFDNGDILCAVHRHVVGRLRTDESAADDYYLFAELYLAAQILMSYLAVVAQARNGRHCRI